MICTPATGTWIYFLVLDRGSDRTRVKIGESKTPEKRRREHQRAGGLGVKVDAEPICEVRGARSDETFIQRYFAHLAWPGETEVFYPQPEITEYMRWLRNQWFVAVESTSDDERKAMTMVDSTMWLPDETRRLSPPPIAFDCPLFADEADPLFFPPRMITGDDFYTNEIIIEAARSTLGGIDLDPASHAVANQVVQASRFYTIGDNGLSREWAGRVWLNPPFSQWQDWVPKILSEWGSGRIESMCVLSAMRTVTAQYFHPLMEKASAMCIIKGRIKFWGGKAGDSPDDGHAIFYFGSDVERFRQLFSSLGRVW